MAKQGATIASKTYLKSLSSTHNLSNYNLFEINSFVLIFVKDLFDFAMFSDNNDLNKHTELYS